MEACPDYEGPVAIDFYGRLHPKHTNGTVKMPMDTNSVSTVAPRILEAFDKKTDHRLLYRRLGICADGVHEDSGFFQLNRVVHPMQADRHLFSLADSLMYEYFLHCL